MAWVRFSTRLLGEKAAELAIPNTFIDIPGSREREHILTFIDYSDIDYSDIDYSDIDYSARRAILFPNMLNNPPSPIYPVIAWRETKIWAARDTGTASPYPRVVRVTKLK